MVGEIRDTETAKISIESALTGHFVLSSMHTNDAPGAITRLNEMGVEPSLTGSAVSAVLAQRLARKLCTQELESLAVTRANREDLERAAISQGMRTLWDDGLAKVASGVTSLEELGRVLV